MFYCSLRKKNFIKNQFANLLNFSHVTYILFKHKLFFFNHFTTIKNVYLRYEFV